MSKIIILKKNIIDFDTDCIVNATNIVLKPGKGVSGSIFKAAGFDKLSNACNLIGGCNTGEAVITPSFNLKKNKFIIHTVGPIFSYDRIQYCRDKLYNSYVSSLKLIVENNCNSIAFPLLSTGKYGYPVEEAWSIAIEACINYIKNSSNNLSIFFSVINDHIHDIGNEMLSKVLSDEYKDSTLTLYETVGYLHKIGYEKIRLMSYYSPSGCYFRTVVSTKDNFDYTGFVCDDLQEDKIYKHTDGQGFNYFEDGNLYDDCSIDIIAKKLLSYCPYLSTHGYGSDSEYVNWFKDVLKYTRNGIFPYAFEDYGYDIYIAKFIKMTSGIDKIEYAPPGDLEKNHGK